MNQQLTALRILHRHERAVVAEMEKQIGPQMEPKVKAIYDAKRANVAALEGKLKVSSSPSTNTKAQQLASP